MAPRQVRNSSAQLRAARHPLRLPWWSVANGETLSVLSRDLWGSTKSFQVPLRRLALSAVCRA
jgi:hypothetical protein